MKKKKLYIIGNGFDLHHWQGTETESDTSYKIFGNYLKNHQPEIFDWLIKTCGFPSDPLLEPDPEKIWIDFEAALANFDGAEILEHSQDYMDDSNPHHSGEASWVANKIIDDLTTNVRAALKQFILELSFPNDISSIAIPIESDALFLSFNYTDTLEHYYDIHRSNICYIHGKAKDDDELQLGHGVLKKNFEYEKVEQSLPLGLTVEEEENWRAEMADQYSLSYELAAGEIEQYWNNSFKNTKKHITSNNDFFSKLDGIEEVIVMGHSLSDVDLPYFNKVRKSISPDAKWSASYFSEEEKERMRCTLTNLGIPKGRICLFTLESLTV